MNDDQLKQALGKWKSEVSVPAAFHAKVWERIAAREEAREQTTAAQWRRWLTSFFLQPARVVVLGVIMLATGIGTGWWKGSQDRVAEWNRLEREYVVSIDPYTRTHTLAGP